MRGLFFGSAALVAYTFIGYPALLGVLARLRPRPVAADTSFEPSISVVIAAYNEADVITRRLENVWQLDYPHDRLEVIVVADGSDDGTDDRARAFPGTTVLHQPERAGKLAAMNRAAASARGDVFVFTDANNLFSQTALRELAAPFADPAVGVVTGRKMIDDQSGRELDRAEGVYWRYESKIKIWESRIGSVIAVAGEMLAFRREAFVVVQPGPFGEDFVQAALALANGWRVVYVPEAVSVERASATLDDEAVRRARIVAGRMHALARVLPVLARRNPQAAWQVVSHKALRPLVPPALALCLASNAALARRRAWARAVLAAQATFYASALLGWSMERRGRRSRILYLPYYFVRMNGASVRGVFRFALRRESSAWEKVNRG